MNLKTYIRSIWADNPEHYARSTNEDAIFLPFLPILWLASFMATNQNIIGLDVIPCTKIAWKIQIWSQIWDIRCITSSNLTFFVDFGALLFLFKTHMAAFSYESTTCRKISPPSIDQLFVLFHLVGVACLPGPALMNFWHGLGVQLQKSDQKMTENAK